MKKDLKSIFKEDSVKKSIALPNGHEERFLAKLDIPKVQGQKRIVVFWKAAAAVVVLLSTVYLTNTFYEKNNPAVTVPVELVQKEKSSFGKISPSLEKIESYYVAAINLQLSTLKFSETNKELLEGYLLRLNDLEIDYKKLTLELNEQGPNEATVSALIDNLKLRLDLLFKLKDKLNKLKKSNHGNHINESI